MKSDKESNSKVSALPCPFCGVKPDVSVGGCAPAGVGTAWGCTITCKSKRCGVSPQLSTYTKHYSDRDKLKADTIKLWNKRNNRKQ
ncbi:MAG: restriction alleviation protein [Podoviridae sp. ctrTa16]|nr:MAG: restriction alleviation protein [Podoviridae sp. ctrTa16]